MFPLRLDKFNVRDQRRLNVQNIIPAVADRPQNLLTRSVR